MKKTIYFFTGTGNSLAVAKKIALALEDCELISISTFRDKTEDIIPEAECIGIICPVYFTGLPRMVALFAERLDLCNVRYVFSVVTNGGGGEKSTLFQLDEIIRKKNLCGLSAGFSVRMPGNYILMYEPPTGDKQDKILESANFKIEKIIEDIKEGKEKLVQRSIIWSIFHTLFYPKFISDVQNKDKNFSVSDNCSSCGICVSACPAANIELLDGKPIWKHHCELCCRCIHLCPEHAIQAGKKTVGRARYKNPEITISELQNSGSSLQD